jgi:hypothetical protein
MYWYLRYLYLFEWLPVPLPPLLCYPSNISVSFEDDIVPRRLFVRNYACVDDPNDLCARRLLWLDENRADP